MYNKTAGDSVALIIGLHLQPATRVSPQNVLAHFVVDEDNQREWHGRQPPGETENKCVRCTAHTTIVQNYLYDTNLCRSVVRTREVFLTVGGTFGGLCLNPDNKRGKLPVWSQRTDQMSCDDSYNRICVQSEGGVNRQ